MEPKAERPQEVEGLRLVHAYLALPPDKRARVLKFVEELSREQGRESQETEASST